MDKYQNPIDTGSQMPMNNKNEGRVGPIIGTIIILVIIILGGIYYAKLVKETIDNRRALEQSQQEAEKAEADLANQSTGDSVESIQADLDKTNIDVLDAELDQIK